MAPDLRTELIKALRRAWRNVPGTDMPEATPIPEDVARDIINHYTSQPGHSTTLNEDATGVLPILARLRPRGLFEDDWRARPSTSKPWPVVLIHGTGATKGDWQELGEELRADGWAVFAPDFGKRATASIKESAEQIGAYVDAVLQVTGADKVILAGHSQGGVLARYWMRFFDGYPKVKHLVCLAAPNHGTTMGGIVSQAVRTPIAENLVHSVISSWFGGAGFEMIHDHDTITSLNAGGDLDPGVTYTCIATHFDYVIQPPETCFLHGADESDDDRVRNLWVEDLDATAVIRHDQMPYDWRVRKLVRASLDLVVEEEFGEKTDVDEQDVIDEA